MSLRKKDLKMMYSLRWKDDPKREASSFVFVYDIPGITMNYEVFKNYLLKNSGNPEEDINVSYIMDSGKEFFIDSQSDFQTALYDFRRNARAGDVIDLLLERASSRLTRKIARHSNDAETQFDTVQEQLETGEWKSHPLVSSCFNDAEAPPEWFKVAIAQLKKELAWELTNKMELIASDFLQSFKLERKLEMLEQKASQCRSRQLSLQSADILSDLEPKPSDVETRQVEEEFKFEMMEQKASQCGSRQHSLEPGQKLKSNDSEAGKVEDEPQIDARPINVQTSFPHMLGGEIYRHQWEVKNTGQVPWNSWTQLQYTWGSKKLVPLEKTVSVPHLAPGEEGVVQASLQIPTERGKYECYWTFVHKGRRFGHCLGVQVVVDGLDLKGATSPFKTDLETELHNLLFDRVSERSWSPEPTRFWPKAEEKDDFVLVSPQDFVLGSPEQKPAQPETVSTNSNGTEDNSIKLRDREMDSIVVITVPKDEQVKEGFIYVHVDGQKVLVPKNILKSEVVTAAEELERSPSVAKSIGVIVDEPTPAAATPSVTQTDESPLTVESPTPSTITQIVQPCAESATYQEYLTPPQAVDLTTIASNHSDYFEAPCSATGSSEANAQARVLEFPQDIPDCEVAPEDQPTRVVAGNAPKLETRLESSKQEQTARPSASTVMARWFMNRFKSQQTPGRRVNPVTPREENMEALADMGFWNFDLNATLLDRYNDDINRVVAELVR